MLEKLKELLEMQRALDENIYTTHNVEYDEEKSYLALIDEIGELNHELKAKWCWWKKTVKPVDREKVLDELVDVWHFALSIFYHHFYFDNGIYVKECNINVYENYKLFLIYKMLLNKYLNQHILELMIALTHKLGFTFDDVYEAYKKKNAINYERLKNGY